MAGASIGFGRNKYVYGYDPYSEDATAPGAGAETPGFLGALGRSLYGGWRGAEQGAESGGALGAVGGLFKGFLAPGIPMTQDAMMARRARDQQDYAALEPLIDAGLSHALHGEPEQGLAILGHARLKAQMLGRQPDDQLLSIIDNIDKSVRRGNAANLDLGGQNPQRWQQLAQQADDPNKMAQIMHEGAGADYSEEQRQGLAQTRGYEAQDRPINQQLLQMKVPLTQAEINQRNAATAASTAQTGLYGTEAAGKQTENEINQERLQAIRDTGMDIGKPGTAKPDYTSNRFVKDYNKRVADTLRQIYAGKPTGMGLPPTPYTDEEKQGLMAALDQEKQDIEATFPGVSLSSLAIVPGKMVSEKVHPLDESENPEMHDVPGPSTVQLVPGKPSEGRMQPPGAGIGTRPPRLPRGTQEVPQEQIQSQIEQTPATHIKVDRSNFNPAMTEEFRTKNREIYETVNKMRAAGRTQQEIDKYIDQQTRLVGQNLSGLGR